MFIYHHPTPLGTARIVEDDGFIVSVTVHDDKQDLETPHSALLATAAQQIDEYFSGTRKTFELPVKQLGTTFQQQVWQQLQNIPFGTTTSYAALSKQMKNPLAIRAIAAANGKNSLWIIVPCHRVIGSDGSLTGYAGGLWRKQWLLEHEATVSGMGQTMLAF